MIILIFFTVLKQKNMQVIRSNKPDYLNIKIRNSQLLTFIIYRINTYKQLSCQVISKSIPAGRHEKFNRLHVK